MELAHGFALAHGAKPDFRELHETEEEARLAEAQWEAAQREREAMQGRGGNHVAERPFG